MAQTSGKDYGSKNGKSKGVPMWRKNTSDTEHASWHLIDADTLRGAVDAVTKAGGALMLAVTSDGGAYSLCVLFRDEKMKEYPHGKVECEATLRMLTEYFAEYLL